MRNKLGVGGVLVMKLARHFHHLASLSLPDRQEVGCPRVIRRPHTIVQEREARPSVCTGFRSEHGMGTPIVRDDDRIVDIVIHSGYGRRSRRHRDNAGMRQ